MRLLNLDHSKSSQWGWARAIVQKFLQESTGLSWESHGALWTLLYADSDGPLTLSDLSLLYSCNYTDVSLSF